MTWGYVAMAAATVVSTAIQSSAAEDAEDAQYSAYQKGLRGIQEATERGDELLGPLSERALPALDELAGYGAQREIGGPLMEQYTSSGAAALGAREALLGLRGPEAYQEQIDLIEQSPQMQAMLGQSEEAILQNAAATGGLRGGNVQEALMRNRPQVLNALIGQRMQGLEGLSSQGLGASQFLLGSAQQATRDVAGMGQQAMLTRTANQANAARAMADLFAQQGEAAAAGKTAQGGLLGGAIGSLGGMVGGMF